MKKTTIEQITELFTDEGRWRIVPMGAVLCGLAMVILGLSILVRMKIFGDAAWGSIMTLAGLAIVTVMSSIFFSQDESEALEESPLQATKSEAELPGASATFLSESQTPTATLPQR